MKRDHVKDALYGAMEEILCDPKYFWPGIVSSTITDDGKRALEGLILIFGRAIVTAHRENLDELARNITLNQLTKENQ